MRCKLDARHSFDRTNDGSHLLLPSELSILCGWLTILAGQDKDAFDESERAVGGEHFPTVDNDAVSPCHCWISLDNDSCGLCESEGMQRPCLQQTMQHLLQTWLPNWTLWTESFGYFSWNKSWPAKLSISACCTLYLPTCLVHVYCVRIDLELQINLDTTHFPSFQVMELLVICIQLSEVSFDLAEDQRAAIKDQAMPARYSELSEDWDLTTHSIIAILSRVIVCETKHLALLSALWSTRI